MTKFEEMSADLESFGISGYLGTRYVQLPLISHITDNLYVGGVEHGAEVNDFFSHIYSFFDYYRHVHSPETMRVFNRMEDTTGSPVDIELLDKVVPEIVEALELGGNVLVHCQAGINRSNLVAARVLMSWKGLTAAQAIDMLREKRDDIVLANHVFEDYLRSLDD